MSLLTILLSGTLAQQLLVLVAAVPAIAFGAAVSATVLSLVLVLVLVLVSVLVLAQHELVFTGVGAAISLNNSGAAVSASALAMFISGGSILLLGQHELALLTGAAVSVLVLAQHELLLDFTTASTVTAGLALLAQQLLLRAFPPYCWGLSVQTLLRVYSVQLHLCQPKVQRLWRW